MSPQKSYPWKAEPWLQCSLAVLAGPPGPPVCGPRHGAGLLPWLTVNGHGAGGSSSPVTKGWPTVMPILGLVLSPVADFFLYLSIYMVRDNKNGRYSETSWCQNCFLTHTNNCFHEILPNSLHSYLFPELDCIALQEPLNKTSSSNCCG